MRQSRTVPRLKCAFRRNPFRPFTGSVRISRAEDMHERELEVPHTLEQRGALLVAGERRLPGAHCQLVHCRRNVCDVIPARTCLEAGSTSPQLQSHSPLVWLAGGFLRVHTALKGSRRVT